MPKLSRGVVSVLLGGILCGSFVLNAQHIGYGVGFHPDEIKKAVYVEKHIQDFNHPLLMLQVSRVANIFVAAENRDVLVVLGRIINALVATGIVWVSYFIARRGLNQTFALIVSAAMAVSPILVVHAHYFKEDIFLTFFSFLTILLFLKKNPAWGVALGLALSSHYKAALLAGLLIVYSLPKERRRVVVPALVSAGAVFLAVNYPLITEWNVFKEGALYEAAHAVTGHEVVRPITNTYGVFHFVHSLWPGITPLAAIISIAAMVYVAIFWKRLRLVDHLMWSFAALYYVVMEISPLKPGPDYSRYILPAVPGFLYLSVRVAEQMYVKAMPPIQRLVLAVLVVAFFVWPAADTLRYNRYLADDTRMRVQQRLASQAIPPEEVSYEGYSSLRVDTVEPWTHYMTAHNADEFQKQGIRYIVVNSFQYERFSEGTPQHKGYQQLFEYPYIEITPGFKSFAFSNPIVRVVDIGK